MSIREKVEAAKAAYEEGDISTLTPEAYIAWRTLGRVLQWMDEEEDERSAANQKSPE